MLVFGLLVAVVSGIAAWLQVATILWGPRDLRFPLMTLDWPEADAKIEGKQRVRLEDDYGLRLSDSPAPTEPGGRESARREGGGTAGLIRSMDSTGKS